MDESKKVVQKRKEKIIAWFKNPQNVWLAGILLLALIIRIYYFWLTKSQPLWWDEADYLAYAKTLAGFPGGWIITDQHISLFPYLVAALFKIGVSEELVKFILELLPSVIVVLLTYMTVTEMYKDKRIALIATFLMATFWAVLFNSMRFHLGVPALFFGLLAIYTFWKGYEKKEKILNIIPYQWAIPLTVAFVALTYATRRGYFLFGFFFLIYMLATRPPRELFKDKYNWIGLGVAIVLIVLIEQFIFAGSIGEVAGRYYVDAPLSLLPFDVFPSYFTNTANPALSPLLHLFWIGVIVLLLNIALHAGLFYKSRAKKFNSDVFAIIMIAVVLAYFLFFQRRAESFGEPRWYFPLILGAFIAISRGTLAIADYLKKYIKVFAIVLVVIVIGFGGWYQLQQADGIIKNRVNSFTGIKDTGLLLKDYANVGDVTVSIPRPQPAYYAERQFIQPREVIGQPTIRNQEVDFEEFLTHLREREDIRFIIVTFSEPSHPEWMIRDSYVQHQNGQVVIGKREIPFMDSEIDFTTGNQDIKQSKTYDDLEFRLVTVQSDTLLYEIIRS